MGKRLGDAVVEVRASLARGKLRAFVEPSQVLRKNLASLGIKFTIGAVKGGNEASMKLRRRFVGEAFNRHLCFSKSSLGIFGESLEAAGNLLGLTAISD